MLYFKEDFMVSAGVIVIHDNKALAIFDINTSEIYLPKGGVNPNEKIEDAAKREVEEETGYICDITDELGMEIRYSECLKITKLIWWFKGSLVGKGEQKLEDHEAYLPIWINSDEIDKVSFPKERKLMERSFL